MLEELVRNLHDTVALLHACRLSRHIEQIVEPLGVVLDLIGKTLLALTVFLVNRAAIVGDELAELVDDSVHSLFLQRFHDKYDFVLSHEITSSSVFGPPP